MTFVRSKPLPPAGEVEARSVEGEGDRVGTQPSPPSRSRAIAWRRFVIRLHLPTDVLKRKPWLVSWLQVSPLALILIVLFAAPTDPVPGHQLLRL